jgi:hypothetical protein
MPARERIADSFLPATEDVTLNPFLFGASYLSWSHKAVDS